MELGYVTPVEIKQAIKEQQSNGTELKLGEILVRMGACDAEDVAKGLSKQFDLGYVNLAEIQVPPELVTLLPKDQVVDHNIVPLKRTDKKLYIAVADPLDFFVLDNLRFILGCEIECVLASKRAIGKAIEKYYGITGTAMDEVLEEAAGKVTVRPAGSWEKSEIFSSGEPMEIEMVLETVDLMVAEMIAPSNKRTAIRSSLREALGNAVKWGHEGDESKMLDIMYLREGKAITITVSDKGSGFDPSPHLERPYDEEELKKSGRGARRRGRRRRPGHPHDPQSGRYGFVQRHRQYIDLQPSPIIFGIYRISGATCWQDTCPMIRWTSPLVDPSVHGRC